MPKGIRLRLFATAALFAAAVAAKAQEASNAPARFDQVGEVVDQWSADQHLWVNGKLPVSDSHLAGLEQWLGENAPNWTVVLMQNAKGQSFQNYRGMDAVEHAMGKQLANQTDFGNLKDKRTGESNGAFFILFLEERKFSYYGSDAFDKRSLGENRWVGRLDKPAIAAMRGGGRIVDAVKDTVTSIESQLTRKIQSEETAKKRAAIERQRSIEEARQLPAQIGAEVDRMEKEISDFRDRNAGATGDLVQIPAASWRGAAKAITGYAEAEDTANAGKLADRIRKEIGGFRSGLALWEKDKAQFDRLENRLKTLEVPEEVPSIQGHQSRALGALGSARENHQIAESLYRDQIDAADRSLDQAFVELRAWEASVIAEQRRLRARKAAIQAASVAGALLFLIALIVLNRLRAPAKREAKKALADWESKLKGKFDRLFQLMDRASIIVGPSAELEGRGFDGTTLELCRETIHEVDELFIMSSATDGVIDRVENLVEPKSPWGLLVNAFFSSRYRRAIALLGSKPIGFDRSQGLGAILEPAQKLNPEAAGRSLLGDPDDYEPFQMSFEQLVSAYDEKQGAAIATVDRLEHCIDGLPLLLEELNALENEIGLSAAALAESATEDTFFPAENLRNELLPETNRRLEEASESGRYDPVTAMENPATEARRQIDSARRLTSRLEKVRSDDFAKVLESAEQLESLGRRVAWIDDYYGELSNQSEQLSKLMIDREVDSDLDEFEDGLLRVRGRIQNAAKLARRAEEEIAAAIETTAADATEARKELARQLRLSPQDVLSEEDLSPFSKIDAAGKELDAARSALDRGNVEAAQEDFAEIEKSLEESAGLLALSREVADSHVREHETLTNALEDTREHQPHTAALLSEMIKRYDPGVLRFSARTGEKPRGQDSIRDSAERAEKRLATVESTLDESLAAFSAGHLIAAGGLLERAGNEIGFARHQLSLIEDQHDALKKAEGKNEGDLAELNRRHGDLADAIADRRTMTLTIKQYQAAEAALKRIAGDLAADRPNPFAVMLALENQDEELNAIEQGIESDRTLFDTATLAAEDALQKVSAAEAVAREAETDRIPDSAEMERGIARHRQLAEYLATVEAALGVDHGDWAAVQEASLAVVEESLKARSTMEIELRSARAAVEELRRASATITALQGWKSRHRVGVQRGAGLQHFTGARDALATGNYALAVQLAANSRGDAQWELNRARAAERSKIAEIKRRRRRRQRSSFGVGIGGGSSFGSGGISFGGSGGSSFGGGGGSGFSSGSFSSGSGVSRSGW